MQIQRVMRLPEPGLPGGAHRHLGGRQGIRVDAREGEINEYPPHFARSNELAVDGRHDRDRKHPAGGALKVRHFVDGDGRRGRPLRPGGQGVYRLCEPPPPPQPPREQEARENDGAVQGPDFVQMAMTPHWESALRNSAGASLALR